jgi:hypothetical protein
MGRADDSATEVLPKMIAPGAFNAELAAFLRAL